MVPDYIIVGAGSAGCVLANRLSEEAGVSVVLLEAGGSDRHWHYQMPLAWLKAVMNARAGWNYQSEPEPYLNHRRLPVPRGKVLGGCSSINGMMYARGHPSDYDSWADLGLDDWSFERVLPYFRRAETSWRGETARRGGSGPLGVSRLQSPEQNVTRELLATAVELGYEQLEDFCDGSGLGFGIPDFTVKDGRRSSASAAYLRPVLERSNLTVVSGALTTRLMIEGRHVRGVVYSVNGRSEFMRCRREVILCAGAINSPQLLMLSGIGRGRDLRAVGIEPVHELSGVGENLQDHTTIICNDALCQPVGFESMLRIDRICLAGARWFIDRGGPAGRLPFGAQAFLPLADEPSRPGVQMIFTPVSKEARPWFPGLVSGVGHQLTTVGVQMHPKSRGRITLQSPVPTIPPQILFNMLKHPDDRAAMREIVRLKRTILGAGPISSLLGNELVPGTSVETDEELDSFIRDNVGTSFHPVGTCAMGATDEAVVDQELKVRGLQGLRVADASVMPLLPSGNTNIPTIMIAEKAADLIRFGSGRGCRKATTEAGNHYGGGAERLPA